MRQHNIHGYIHRMAEVWYSHMDISMDISMDILLVPSLWEHVFTVQNSLQLQVGFTSLVPTRICPWTPLGHKPQLRTPTIRKWHKCRTNPSDAATALCFSGTYYFVASVKSRLLSNRILQCTEVNFYRVQRWRIYHFWRKPTSAVQIGLSA